MGKFVEISGVRKRYKKAEFESLKGVSFHINEGDIFGILGPNGAGKTSLISIMCGIISATKGAVTYCMDGEKKMNDMRAAIGYVPQDFALYPELTAKQNLYYFGALYNLSKAKIDQKLEQILPVLGLEKVLLKKVQTYSGGMKRRLNLAIGILHGPKILFLDEPTVGVDVQSKSAIIRFLQELNQKGVTIVYTSHHMSEAQELCKTVALIDSGEIVAFDELSKLMTDHQAENLENLFIHLTGAAYRD